MSSEYTMNDHEHMMHQLLTELQGQIVSVSHQLTMMNKCLDKVNSALIALPSTQPEIVVVLQEENDLLKKQLKYLQHGHMELLADRRHSALENYRLTYEAAHGIRKGCETGCDCNFSVEHEE